MRMWMVDPRVMCRKHLLGEHVELHMLVGAILKGKSLKGFIDKKLICNSIRKRHSQLVKEMKARGYTHKSPLPPFKYNFKAQVNEEDSLKELLRRCPECRKNHGVLAQDFYDHVNDEVYNNLTTRKVCHM